MEVEKIRPVTPEPDDFDGFWREQLTRMRARVPRVTKIKTTVPENLQGKVKAEDFRLEDDVLTATGILVMPEDASVKKHAAVITFAGASWIGTRPNYRLAADADCLVLGMNLHGKRPFSTSLKPKIKV